jgi:hypothetical protein
MEGAPASLRIEAVGAIGGELRAMLNMDFRELRKAEVEHRRIHLPRTPVNKGKRRKGQEPSGSDPLTV